MEKFSLFDLLSFAIPGGASLILLYWAMLNTYGQAATGIPLPDNMLLIVFLLLSYFAGHLLSEAGARLEKFFGGLPNSWVSILEKSPALAQKLNEIATKHFSINFIKENGAIDIAASGDFYDHAFNVLEVNGKLEKIRILQTQYVFLRNFVALGILAILASSLVFSVNLYKKGNFSDPQTLVPFVCIFVALFLCVISRRISLKRRHMKMSATLHTFYAYYISITTIK